MRSFYRPAGIRQYDENIYTAPFKQNLHSYYFSFLQIGYYDPFVNAHRLGITNVNEWGVFNYLPVDQFNFNETWLLQKEYRMNQFPLTFSIFDRYPSMITDYSRNFNYTGASQKVTKKIGYGGVDGLILGNLAEILDFKAVLISPKDTDHYGHKAPNGSYTGSLGDILYGRADAAFNSRFLIKYDSLDIEFLLPTLGDRVCVVAPSAAQIPQWLAVLRCFDTFFWFALLFTVIVATGAYIWINYYDEMHERNAVHQTVLYTDFRKFVVEKSFSIRCICMKILQVIIGMTTHLPFTHKQRLVIGACFLANRIISGHFEVTYLS